MNHTDYYVYAHRDLNGVIFYIGCGREQRAYKKDGRSKHWKKKIQDGYTVEMLHTNLDKNTSREIELGYILNPDKSWNLVNVAKRNKIVKIDIDFVSKYLYYDETSPTFLRWKVDRYAGKKYAVKMYSAGDVAGNQGHRLKEYFTVQLNGQVYLTHRVIFTLFHGNIPENFVVNHIDNDRTNNRIGNLELCSLAENNRRTRAHNGGLNPLNTSGVTGVRTMTNAVGNKYWIATWRDLTGHQRQKCFSVLRLGETEAFRLACEHRKQMIEKLNSEGAGYSIAE